MPWLTQVVRDALLRVSGGAYCQTCPAVGPTPAQGARPWAGLTGAGRGERMGHFPNRDVHRSPAMPGRRARGASMSWLMLVIILLCGMIGLGGSWCRRESMAARALALALLSLVVSVCIAWGWEEPAGFRDIPWGASPAQVKQKLPGLTCEKDCIGHLRIGDVRVIALIDFDTGGMDLVSISFPSDSFYAIKVAFVERYGQPHAQRKETVQTKGGALYENEILEWNGTKVLISLKQYSGTVSESVGRIETVEGKRVRHERYREKAKAGKKDL